MDQHDRGVQQLASRGLRTGRLPAKGRPAVSCAGPDHQQLAARVADFVGDVSEWPSDSEIDEYLNLAEGYEPKAGTAVPLGDLGGVPPTASDVDLASILRESDPEMADQVLYPDKLLLPLD